MVRDPRNRSAKILGGRTRHGWFVWASEAPIASVLADLVAVLRYARKHGCDYVLLDCDALPMADLPVSHSDFQDQSIPPATF
jgi:hypothetical protein